MEGYGGNFPATASQEWAPHLPFERLVGGMFVAQDLVIEI